LLFSLQDFDCLYHRVAFDDHFLRSTLKHVAQTDDFTQKLLDIYDETFDSMQRTQPVVLTIQRADYMFDEVPGQTGNPVLKQA